MRIALITIHWANNYGSTLQSYASLQVLSRYGKTSIIDYRNAYVNKGMQLIRFGFSPRDVLRVGKDLCRLRPRYRVIRKFKRFSYEYLGLLSSSDPLADLSTLESEYDVFVSGSDQIWNPKVVSQTYSLDLNYLLSFIKRKRRVSYASSTGGFQFSEFGMNELKRELSEYSSISVREADTARELSSLLDSDIAHVADPTLMLTKEMWIECLGSERLYDRPYILVYALSKDSLLKRTIRCVEKILNLDVVVIDQDPFIGYKSHKHLKSVGPDEFVKYFLHASFVITNSFHGTLFATNFNIPFVITEPSNAPNRIIGFLEAVCSMSRYLEKEDDVDYKVDQILSAPLDFKTINVSIERLRKHTWDFLDAAFLSR